MTVGFGRGSKDLGVPTANLPPEPLKDVLPDLPSGVYFGCANLATDGRDQTPSLMQQAMNGVCRALLKTALYAPGSSWNFGGLPYILRSGSQDESAD